MDDETLIEKLQDKIFNLEEEKRELLGIQFDLKVEIREKDDRIKALEEEVSNLNEEIEDLS